MTAPDPPAGAGRPRGGQTRRPSGERIVRRPLAEAGAPRGFIVHATAAYLGLYTALLASALVTVPLRVGEVDPHGKESSLGLVAGVGALVAVVANPLFGRLSDRTTSRLGRRRPWLVGGVLGGTTGLTIIAVIPSIPAIVLGWSLAQLAFNATLAALAATIPDQVPVRQRGRVRSRHSMRRSTW